MECNYKYLLIRRTKLAFSYNFEIILKILNKEIGFLFIKLGVNYSFSVRFIQ